MKAVEVVGQQPVSRGLVLQLVHVGDVPPADESAEDAERADDGLDDGERDVARRADAVVGSGVAVPPGLVAQGDGVPR